MTQTVYRNAPIVEAVIDIQVADAAAISQSALSKCCDDLASQYPRRSAVYVAEVKVPLAGSEADSDPSVEQSIAGYRLTNAAGSWGLFVRKEGLAISHLAPYSHWAAFRSEAEVAWRAYVNACNPKRVSRVGVRFINNINTQLRSGQPEKFLKVFPRLPDLRNDDVTGMFMQVQMPQPDIDSTAMALLNVALGAPAGKERHLVFVLDIDVFHTTPYDPASSELWSALDRMRERKNELFEACITDRTRELIS